MIITIKGKVEIKNLYISGLQFGGVVKRVERYWEARPNLMCMKCFGIGYKHIESYRDWPSKYVICIGLYKVEDYCCSVVGYNKKKRKICIYITAKYAK